MLWRSLHEAMVADDGWPDGPPPTGYPLSPVVAGRVSALRGESIAARLAERLVGSGPWRWGSDLGVYFMRGGFMVTPWGTARWGASDDGKRLVIFLCGVENPSHSATLAPGDAKLIFTSAPPKRPVGDVHGSAAATAAGGERSEASLDGGGSLAPELSAADRTDAATALAADAQPGNGEQGGGPESADEVRRRLLGSGPWPLPGVGDLLFLARGVLQVNMGLRNHHAWHVEPSQVANRGHGCLVTYMIDRSGCSCDRLTRILWELQRLPRDCRWRIAAA